MCICNGELMLYLHMKINPRIILMPHTKTDSVSYSKNKCINNKSKKIFIS